MSNEKQLTPIGEAIKHTKDRIRDLLGLQEEKTGFERGQLSHRIHELELQQKMLRSLLPKEKDQLIRAHLYGQEKPQCAGDYPDGEQYYNETFKTESDE